MEGQKISVIMATFNEPVTFIEQSIESILNQTYRNIELLIADDSTDEKTRQVIDRFASMDTRIKIIRKDQRMGFVPALNLALDSATGDFIARMDGDDISLPYRFEKETKYLNEHPEVDICGGDLNIMDENGIISSVREYPVGTATIRKYFIYRCPIAHPTAMFRRTIIDKGYRYNPAFRKAEDLDFWLRLRNAGYRFGNLGEPMLNYRVVGDLASKRSRDHYKYLLKARRENFSWKRLLLDVPSLIIFETFNLVPMSIISWYYNRENGQ